METAQVSSGDKPFIEAVLSLVDESVAAGRHPFAALVVAADGQVLAKAINGSAPPDGIPTQHAELQAAAESHRVCPPLSRASVLAGSTLYTSVEPCAMCAGAIYWCGIGRVVYLLSEEDLRGCTGDHPENPTLDLPCRLVFDAGPRAVHVVGPIPEFREAALKAHLTFWKRS